MDSLDFDMKGYKKAMEDYKSYMIEREMVMDGNKSMSKEPFKRAPRTSDFIFCSGDYLKYSRTGFGNRYQIFITKNIDGMDDLICGGDIGEEGK